MLRVKQGGRMSVKHLYLVAVLVTLGCSSSGQSEASALAAQPRSSTYLTLDEMVAAKTDAGSMYDALMRLRPNWLAPHGTMSSNSESNQYATVYMDGQQVGSLDNLRRIPAYSIATARYHDITQAGARFGLRGGMGGVIEITSRVK
jgi:hypothetical protein